MKNKLITCLTLSLLATLTSVMADQSENVTMKEGGFWSIFEVQGQYYFNGKWSDPAFDVNDPAAVAASLAGLTALRSSDPEAYKAHISTLNLAMDVEGANVAAINTALVNQLTWVGNNQQMQDADWSKANFAGKSLMNKKLQNTNITGSQLNGATQYTFVNLSGLDLSGLTSEGIAGKSLQMANFSNSTGLDPTALNASIQFTSTNLSGIDLTGFNPAGKTLNSANISNTTGFDFSKLTAASQINSMQIQNVDMTGFNAAGMTFSQVNFTGSTNLTPQMLAGATNWSGITLTGTGINKAALKAALITAGKTESAAETMASSVTY